jgi:hypothetical protein
VSGGGRDRAGRDVDAGSAARSFLRRLDADGQGLDRAQAVSAWRDAAGDEVASHARGFTLREGELVVLVDSGVWATELSALSEHYRAAVNERLGKETVRAVRFTVSKMVAEERWWEAATARPSEGRDAEMVEPVPVSDTELAQIRMMAAGVHDERVRQAVVAAATRHLEWRKGIQARKSAQRAAERPRGPESGVDH